MVKILNCYLYAKKSHGTLSKGAIFLAIPVYFRIICIVFVFIISQSCVNSNCVRHWLSCYVSLFTFMTINRFRLSVNFKLFDLFE